VHYGVFDVARPLQYVPKELPAFLRLTLVGLFEEAMGLLVKAGYVNGK